MSHGFINTAPGYKLVSAARTVIGVPYVVLLLGRHPIDLVASKICASARAQPPRVPHGLNSHTACAIGGVESWTSSQERQKGCVKRLTPMSVPDLVSDAYPTAFCS